MQPSLGFRNLSAESSQGCREEGQLGGQQREGDGVGSRGIFFPLWGIPRAWPQHQPCFLARDPTPTADRSPPCHGSSHLWASLLRSLLERCLSFRSCTSNTGPESGSAAPDPMLRACHTFPISGTPRNPPRSWSQSQPHFTGEKPEVRKSE